MASVKMPALQSRFNLAERCEKDRVSDAQFSYNLEIMEFAASMAEELAVMVGRLSEETAQHHFLMASVTLRMKMIEETKRRVGSNVVPGSRRAQ